jgi:hypothetical protein
MAVPLLPREPCIHRPVLTIHWDIGNLWYRLSTAQGTRPLCGTAKGEAMRRSIWFVMCGLGLCLAWVGHADPQAFTPLAYHPLFTAQERERPHVQGRSFHFYDYPYLDGQWEGILCDSDGDVWFGISSHTGINHAQLFRYHAKTDRVAHVADLGQVCGEKLTGNPPQDKIHSQMFQDGDLIYCGTCEGHMLPNNPYKGGYWLAINRATGVVANLGKSLTNDGLLCVGYDPWRKLLYGHTNRTGELTVFDPATRKERVLGVPWQDVIDAWKANPDPKKPREIWPRGLTLMITRDGQVYGVKPPSGTFWCYDPGTEQLTTFTVAMPLPAELQAHKAAGTTPAPRVSQQWEQSAFHLHLWDEQAQCFYLIRSFDQMLCRFYPPAEGKPARLETLREMGLPERRYDNRLAACTLVQVGRTIYYTPYTGWGGTTALTSYHLDTRTYTNHGPIVVEGDRRVNEVHSLAAGPDGRLYMVAFVFSIAGVDPVRENAMRDKYPFHPRFVIIDPQRDLKPGAAPGR